MTQEKKKNYGGKLIGCGWKEKPLVKIQYCDSYMKHLH